MVESILMWALQCLLTTHSCMLPVWAAGRSKLQFKTPRAGGLGVGSRDSVSATRTGCASRHAMPTPGVCPIFSCYHPELAGEPAVATVSDISAAVIPSNSFNLFPRSAIDADPAQRTRTMTAFEVIYLSFIATRACVHVITRPDAAGNCYVPART